MAVRLSRIERELGELLATADRPDAPAPPAIAPDGLDVGRPRPTEAAPVGSERR
jgi:hypothetical protein